jgi:hypothetical protein
LERTFFVFLAATLPTSRRVNLDCMNKTKTAYTKLVST